MELLRPTEADSVLDGLDPSLDTNMQSADLQMLLGTVLKSDDQLSLSQLLSDHSLGDDAGMANSHSSGGALGLPNVPQHSIAAGLNTIDLRDIVPSEDSMRDLEEVLTQNDRMAVDMITDDGKTMLQQELEFQRKQEHDLLLRQQLEMGRQQQQQQQQKAVHSAIT
jgi:hypothetical protein